MAVTTPTQVECLLKLPGDTGLALDSIPFSFSSTYTQKSEFDSQLTGSGTFAVPFGTVVSPGAKVVAIKVDAGATAPVNARFNGGGASGQVEIAAGGFIILTAPSPTAGITSIDIVYTADVRLRGWILG